MQQEEIVMMTKRHSLVKSRTAIWLWVFVILCTGLPWDAWGANPLPLSQVPVPEPPNLTQFVKDKAAAIRLGKALFWDMQAGSDGVQACATCHYRAGADPLDVRSRNQLAPRASVSGTSIFQVVGANSTLTGADFPFFQVNPVEAQIGTGTVANNVHDVVGSQGVRLAKFEGVILGSPVESSSALADPTFRVGGNNIRQVTGRNAPSAVNAIFNYANFWDGRASNSFNGSSPIGPLDVNAGIWIDNGGALAKQLVPIPNASLASQSLGPPLSDAEMSFRGRTFPELGRKMLNLTPLGQQTVHPTDSVLGPLSRAVLRPDGTLTGAKGLNKSYQQMIEDAFVSNLTSTNLTVNLNATVGGVVQSIPFTQMEANFSLFWGLAIQLYEATLVSDQTPFDQFLAGNTNAMSAAAQNGFSLFSSQCTKCHSGSELTGASIANAEAIIAGTGTLVEAGATGVGGSVSDIGFSNIGVRPTTDDPGRGGVINFPLSFAGQAVAKAVHPNSISFATFPLPNGTTTASPVAVDGAFKIPSLRNVELTPPYFHNGSAFTLDEVVQFHARGGNFANAEMDAKMKPIGALGNATQRADVVAFLKALTDARVTNESAPFDHPELLLPQGDPEQPMTRLPAKGAAGQPDILPTLTMTVTSPTNLTSQTISGTLEKVGNDVMSAPTFAVGISAVVGPVTVSGTSWSAQITGLVQGENVITATATDLAGVTRTVTKTILAGINKPVGTIVINSGAVATNMLPVNLDLSAAGPNSVDFMQFSLDGSIFSNYEQFAAKRSISLTAGDGTKSVYVRFKDSSGKESVVFSDTITLDTAPSALTINTVTPTNQMSKVINGTVEAGATVLVSVDTSATSGPVTIAGGNWSAKISGLKNGANTVTVTATDTAGNATTKTAVITLDTMPPLLNIDIILGMRGTSRGISGTAEIGSTIAVKCDKAYADVVFFDDFFVNKTRWSAMINRLDQGDNYCKVTATDAAGNITIKDADIVRDDIPPNLDIHVNELVKHNAVQTVSGSVEAGVTPVVTAGAGATVGPVTVNGNSWSCQVSGLSEGANIITVSATDAAGNVTTKSATTTAVVSSGSFSGGTPTIADALKALRIAVGFDNPTAIELLRGDLFDDGLINLSDAILILKKVVGL